MDFSRQSWRKGCFFVSAVAEEGYRDQADDPQGGELPAAVRIGEEEPGRPVHGGNGAKQDRNEGDGGDAAVEAGDQGDAADDLCQHVQIGQSRGETEAAEILYCSGGAEYEELQAGMGEKKAAESHTQKGGG
jgi:hypothetical protein